MSLHCPAYGCDEHLIWGYLEPMAHLRSTLRRIDLLTIDPIVTLGRSETCDIILPCPQISEIHCDIMWNGMSSVNSATIRDVGSKNGTFINECMALGNAWRILRDGDAISFTPPGVCTRQIDYCFTFHYNAAWLPRKPDAPVGEYEIGPKLGGGPRTTVYRGLNTRTGAHVALKQIDARKLQRAAPANANDHSPHGARGALLREVAVLSRLNHPFVVKFEGLYRAGEDTFIVLEFVEGGTLDQWLDEFVKVKKRYLYEREVKHFAFQIFEAVRYCHQRGVAHRDLKPANILLTVEGDVRLADLGEAAFCDGPTIPAPSVFGTPAYTAPEGVSGAELGRPADVFSAGMIVCELLTGWTPRKKDAKKMKTTWLDYLYEELVYARLSDACIEWFLRVLDEDPYTRFTATQALKHNWLAAFTEIHSLELPVADTSEVFHGNHGSENDV